MKPMELVFNNIINCLFFIIDDDFLIVNFLVSVGGEVSYKGLKVSSKPSPIDMYI